MNIWCQEASIGRLNLFLQCLLSTYLSFKHRKRRSSSSGWLIPLSHFNRPTKPQSSQTMQGRHLTWSALTVDPGQHHKLKIRPSPSFWRTSCDIIMLHPHNASEFCKSLASLIWQAILPGNITVSNCVSEGPANLHRNLLLPTNQPKLPRLHGLPVQCHFCRTVNKLPAPSFSWQDLQDHFPHSSSRLLPGRDWPSRNPWIVPGWTDLSPDDEWTSSSWPHTHSVEGSRLASFQVSVKNGFPL